MHAYRQRRIAIERVKAVLDDLLGAGPEPRDACPVGRGWMRDGLRPQPRSPLVEAWHERQEREYNRILATLAKVKPEAVRPELMRHRTEATDYLCASPKQRAKHKFSSPGERTVVLLAALWYGKDEVMRLDDLAQAEQCGELNEADVACGFDGVDVMSMMLRDRQRGMAMLPDLIEADEALQKAAGIWTYPLPWE